MSDTSKEPTDCGHFVVKHSTSKALLVIDPDDEEFWIPKSQICAESDIDTEAEAGDQGELTLPEWLATEKGFV